MQKIFPIFICLVLFFSGLCSLFAQNKNNPRKEKGNIEVSLFISGDLSNAMSQSSSYGSTELNGSIGFTIADTSGWEFNAMITGVSIPDTVKGEYGSNFLITKKGVTSIELNANWRPFMKKKNWFWFFRRVGVYGYFTTSNGLWKYGGDSLIRTSNLGYGLGAMCYLNGVMNEDKPYKIIVGFGLTVRALVGDIGQEEKSALRKRLLNTNKTFFWGTDFNVTLEFDKFSITARYIGLRKRDNDVTGLTKGQLFNSVTFKTDLNIGRFDF